MKVEVAVILTVLFSLTNVVAGSVGISPAYYVEHFEPNLQKNFSFRAFNSNLEDGVSVNLIGLLSQYADVSYNFSDGNNLFSVSLSLPKELDKPGTHVLYVEVVEDSNDSASSAIGGVASIRAPIKILVPYPGQYVESEFRVSNINEGENADYELDIRNLGTDDVDMDVSLEVFRVDENGDRVLRTEVNDLFLETKGSIMVTDELETKELVAGGYYVKATIIYGNKTEVVDADFRIGEFIVDIVDYDYMFEKGRINKFNILVENKWNTKIDSIYADVSITDEGKVVSTFRTVSVDTRPWEVKNLTGFFDAGDMEVGRYLANMNVFYGDSSTHKLVAIYVENPPKERNYFIYALVVIAILSFVMVVGFSILIYRLKKLNDKVKNEKGK